MEDFKFSLFSFVFEAKRFFGMRNSILAGLLLLLSLPFIQVGVARCENSLVMKQKFQDIEKQKIQQYVTYTQYGAYGIRILFLSTPMSILFTNSGVVNDVEAFVDSGERLKIYLPLLGKNLFTAHKKWPVDFSGIILFFGSLLALFYGFDVLYGKEYLRFLAALDSQRDLFISIILPRLVLLMLFFLAVFGCGWGLVYLNGITLPINRYTLFYYLVMCITAACFFSLGALFGTFKVKITASIYALCCWFILLFVFPMTIDSIVESKANNITSTYQLELEKLKIVMDFEKRAIAQAGTFDYGKEPSELDRQLMTGYYKNDFKNTVVLEEDLKMQMQQNIAFYHRLSILSPASFYFAVSNEMSGAGYLSAVEYFDYVQQIKRQFVWFCITKVFFKNFSIVEPVESFITGDQNIYIARPHLMRYAGWGLLINILFTGLFLGTALYRCKKALYSSDGQSWASISAPSPIALTLKKGDFKVWEVRGDFLRHQLFNTLSGVTVKTKNRRSGADFQLTITGHSPVEGNQKENFFYLCHAQEMPREVKAGNFLALIAKRMLVPRARAAARDLLYNKNIDPHKKIKYLSQEELARFMICMLELKPFDIYLINDIARDMTPEFTSLLKEKLEKLTAAGATVLFINSSGQSWLRKNATSRHFIELPVWGKVVDSLVQE